MASSEYNWVDNRPGNMLNDFDAYLENRNKVFLAI